VFLALTGLPMEDGGPADETDDRRLQAADAA
jgi:hypothetical protein